MSDTTETDLSFLLEALERLGNGVLRDETNISVGLAFRMLAVELKRPGQTDWHKHLVVRSSE